LIVASPTGNFESTSMNITSTAVVAGARSGIGLELARLQLYQKL
jgi:hypothetical protein